MTEVFICSLYSLAIELSPYQKARHNITLSQSEESRPTKTERPFLSLSANGSTAGRERERKKERE
jgi:hypothetical protein